MRSSMAGMAPKMVIMHQDGEGFNVMLQALPINGKIVLRPPKDKSEDEPPAKNTERRNDKRCDR
jgi:hypothetical protein